MFQHHQTSQAVNGRILHSAGFPAQSSASQTVQNERWSCGENTAGQRLIMSINCSWTKSSSQADGSVCPTSTHSVAPCLCIALGQSRQRTVLWTVCNDLGTYSEMTTYQLCSLKRLFPRQWLLVVLLIMYTKWWVLSLHCFLFGFWFTFSKETGYVTRIPLPQPFQCWDYRHEPPCPAPSPSLLRTSLHHRPYPPWDPDRHMHAQSRAWKPQLILMVVLNHSIS